MLLRLLLEKALGGYVAHRVIAGDGIGRKSSQALRVLEVRTQTRGRRRDLELPLAPTCTRAGITFPLELRDEVRALPAVLLGAWVIARPGGEHAHDILLGMRRRFDCTPTFARSWP